jgi:peptidoglycan/LPS O-acetylase OafA/YrhL
MHKARIGILDGFRAIAIIAVILFHFFSLEDFKYPYGDRFNFFFQGRYGVEFFFIISEFVIYYTLENTSSLLSFFKKRAIRLYPSAIVASTLTLVIYILFTRENISNLLIKYLTSLSLIGPNILNPVFSPKTHIFNYIDYSLWSLWPEIQFYIIAGSIYFFNKERFIKNFSLFSILLIALYWFISNIEGANSLKINPNNSLLSILNSTIKIFNFISYCQYFTIGLIFYELYKIKNKGDKIPLLLILKLSFFVLVQLYFAIFISTRITNICMLILFAIFIYFPNLISFVDNKLFNKIGVSSYFLYLIHQSIGLILIEKFGKYIFPHSCIFPILLICLFVIISIVYTIKLETPFIKALKTKS